MNEQAPSKAWEDRVAALWATIDDYDETAFTTAMERLLAELPDASPVALYERGSVLDSTGYSDQAVPLYRLALAGGLSGRRRREAVIQLASSLRNIGQAEESVALLQAEQQAGSDDLDDAVSGFLALALASTGQEQQALAQALAALARHMTRYQRSLANYAHELTQPPHG